MTSAVLDSSALLAMLLEEPGGEGLLAVLPDAVISAVNIAEVVGYYCRQGAMAADTRLLLDALSLHVVSFDDAAAHEAGALISQGQRFGLSLGDRACLALARRLRVPAVTADRAWASVASVMGVKVTLIR